MTPDIVAEFNRCFPALATQLSPKNVDRLLSVCTVVSLPAHYELFRERMQVDSLFLVLEGEMVTSIEDAGNILEVGHVKAGDWLGEVAVLSGEMLTSATVTTTTHCRALKVHWYEAEQLILHDEDISYVLLGQLIELLAERLKRSMAAGKKF
jgi:CRP-like cAMP-binding protein